MLFENNHIVNGDDCITVGSGASGIHFRYVEDIYGLIISSPRCLQEFILRRRTRSLNRIIRKEWSRVQSRECFVRAGLFLSFRN